MVSRYLIALAMTTAVACSLGLDENRLTSGAEDQECPDNLLPNPGFELGVTGWQSIAGSIASHEDGRAGSAFSLYAIEDATFIASIPFDGFTTAAGTEYLFEGFVRTDAPGDFEIQAITKEDGPGGDVFGADTVVLLSTSWQRLSARHTVTHEDMESLLLAFRAQTPGSEFLVDDVCLRTIE